jgi:predicted nucleic acid-binding protein
MMLYYLDSSAWAKRYFQETGSEAVDALFEQLPVLACSPLGLIEVGSTMARKRNAREVTDEEFEPKWASPLKDWQRFLRIDVTPSVVLRALDAAGAYGDPRKIERIQQSIALLAPRAQEHLPLR